MPLPDDQDALVPESDDPEARANRENQDLLNVIASIAARRVGVTTHGGDEAELLTESPEVRRAAMELLESLLWDLDQSNDLTAFETDLLRLPINSLKNILEEHGVDDEVLKEFNRLGDQQARVQFVVRRVGRSHDVVSTNILNILFSSKVTTKVVQLNKPLELSVVKNSITRATGHEFGSTEQHYSDSTAHPSHSFAAADGRLFYVYAVEHRGRPIVGGGRRVSRPVRQIRAAMIISPEGNLEFRGPSGELTKIENQFMFDLQRGGYDGIKRIDDRLSQDELNEVATRLNAVLTRETYKPSDEETSGIGQVSISVSDKVNIGHGEADLNDAEGYSKLDEHRSRLRWLLKFSHGGSEHSVAFNWLTERVQFAKGTSNEEVIQHVQKVIRDVRLSRTKKGVR